MYWNGELFELSRESYLGVNFPSCKETSKVILFLKNNEPVHGDKKTIFKYRLRLPFALFTFF